MFVKKSTYYSVQTRSAGDKKSNKRELPGSAIAKMLAVFLVLSATAFVINLRLADYSDLSLVAVDKNLVPLRSDNLKTLNFAPYDQPSFVIDTKGRVLKSTNELSNTRIDGIKGSISTHLKWNDEQTTIEPKIEPVKNSSDKFIVTVPNSATHKPGHYTLGVEVKSEDDTDYISQDFTWGVLAINLNQSTYEPGEEVGIGIGILDDQGATLCDAKVSLTITSPTNLSTNLTTTDGSIGISETCENSNVTNAPDYYGVFKGYDLGLYTITVEAETPNGIRSASIKFEITADASIVTKRSETAMRIYPPANYTVNIEVSSKLPFSGSVKERVPASFEISSVSGGGTVRDRVSYKEIVWQVSLEGAQAQVYSYTYKAPNISPEFYLLGPMRLIEDTGSLRFKEPRSWQIAADAIGDIILLWDPADGAIPAGWTCISCTGGDPFFQRFPRAAATYGGQAGSNTGNHTYTVSNSGEASAFWAATAPITATAAGSNTHTHTWGGPYTTSTDSIVPPYANLRVIRASNPTSLPQNIIGMFDVANASLPAGWSNVAALNNNYLRGDNTVCSSGCGSASHTHTRPQTASVTSGGPSSTTNIQSVGATPRATTNTHTHTIAAGTSPSNNNDPSFGLVNFAKNSNASAPLPNGLIAMFDNTSLPVGWSTISGAGQTYENRLLKGSTTPGTGTTGGSSTHSHGASEVITSGAPSATVNSNQTVTPGIATNTHTHDVTFTISGTSSLPVYTDVILGKLSAFNVSGTVYSDEGTTTLGSVAIKAGIAGSNTRNTTAAANGTYSMTIPNPGTGGIITVWLDTNGGASGAVTTRSNASAITGLDIYQNRLIVRHEDAGPLSNANIGVCDKTSGSVCTDTDLRFDESGGNLTIDNDWRLYIWGAKTFTPGGNVTLSAGATAANVGGDLKWANASSVLNIAANTLSVGGDWINTVGGTFTKSAGQTTTFNGTVSGLTIDASARNFENITFNGVGGIWSFTPAATAVNVDGNFTITNGSVTAPSGNLAVGGSWANSATYSHNSGTVTFNSTTTARTINPGSSSFFNVTFNGSGGAWSPLTNTMNITNDLTMTAGTFDTSSGTANVTVNGNVAGTSGVINFTATNTFTQRVATNKNFGTTSGSTAWTFNNLTFSNSNGGAAPVTVTTQTGGSGGITVGGILRIGASGDSAGATTTLNAGNRTWTLSGTGGDPFQVLASPAASLTPSTSTFAYTGNNTGGDTTVRGITYNHLTLGGASVENYSPSAATTASGNLTINANATLIGTQNITVNGNVTGSGIINLTGGIFTQRVAAAQNFGTTSGSNNWTFNTLRFENSSGTNFTITVNGTGTGSIIANGVTTIGNTGDTNTTTLDDATNNRILDLNSDLTITTRGSLSAPGSASFTIAGSYTNNGTFTHSSGTVVFDSTSGGRTVNGSLIATNKFNNLTFNGVGGGWTFSQDVEVGNNFTITNGSVTAPSGTLTISGNYSNSGTFTHNSGLVLFNSTTTGKTINPGASGTFNNLTFNGVGGGWTVQTNAASVVNDFLAVNGTVGSNVNITVNGNVQCGATCGTINISGGTFTHAVSANKNFGTNVASALDWTFNNLQFSGTTGIRTITINSLGTGKIVINGLFSLTNSGTSLTLDDATNNRIIDANGDVNVGVNTVLQAPGSASFTVAGSWTNSGTFTHSSGTVIFDGTSTGKTINPGSSSFFNVTFNGSGGAWSPLTNTMNITNDLTMTAGTFDTSSGTANVTVNGNVAGTSGVINFTATNTFTQRVATNKNFGTTSGSTAWTFNNLTFSNSSGTPATITTQTGGTGGVTVNSNLVVSATGDSSGTTLNAGNRNWTLANANGAKPFNLDQAGGALTASTSTFTYSGDNDSGNVTIENATFNNLTLGGSVAENYDPEAAITATANLTINANATLIGTQNITVNGNVTGSGIINLTGGIFTQRVAAAQNFGTTSGSNNWTFNTLRFENSSGTNFTITVNGTGTGSIIANGVTTVGNTADTNTTTLNDATNNRILDLNNDLTITNRGSLTAPASASFTIAGSYTNNGTFTHNSGTVTFDSGSGGKVINSGGTGTGKDFSKLIFNNASGGWTISGNNLTTLSDLSLTAIDALTIETGRTVEVRGSYIICNTCPSGTTWTGATLFLNSATNYTVGSKTQNSETYSTLQIGANTDVRLWNSSATTTTVNSSGSLYSQDHSNTDGHLYIYGDYHVTGSDFWEYTKDFDGTSLSAPSYRQVIVRLETGTGLGVAIDSGRSLSIKGGGTGASQCTDVDRIGATVVACTTIGTGGSGVYQLNNSSGSAVLVENTKLNQADYRGGTWNLLNTNNTNPTFTSGTVTVDWYMAIDLVDRDSTPDPIQTGSSDITVSENSGSPQPTVFKYNSGWGSGAATQTNGTDATGKIPQPNNNGAMRIREYSNSSGTFTHYLYNLTISAQTKFATYDFKRDFGSYLTSTLNSASTESKVIGTGWYREDIGTANARPTSVNTLTQTTGTWWISMVKAIILLWDGAGNSPNSQWTCVSCSPGDAFYQKFVRGAATYGGTGGSDTGAHELTFSSQLLNDTAISGNGTNSVATAFNHTHTWDYSTSPDTTVDDIKPPYRQLKFIRGPATGSWPAGVIAPFDTTSTPTNWSAYTAMNGNYLRGEGSVSNGGSATHTHNANALTSSAASAAGSAVCATGCATVPAPSHTHDLGASATASSNNDPLFVQRPFYKLDSPSAAPANALGFFDHTTTPSGWSIVSNNSPFQNNLVKGGSTISSGGNSVHNHGGSISRTSTTPAGGTVTTNTLLAAVARTTHTHDVTHNISSETIMPAYRDVVIMKFSGTSNTAPNNPASLDQIRVTAATSITVGDWTNETQVKFEATVSDTDNPDNLSLCVEKKALGVAFTNSEDLCGSIVAYSGTPVTASVTITSMADATEYHWQARVKDTAGEYSAWVSYGGNAESARDYGVDTTAPATATIRDAQNATPTQGTDAEDNGDGSLTSLSANWDAFNSAVAGLQKYEYSIGTTAGVTDIKGWTDNTTATSVTASGLSLQTNKIYYFNVRATDNAGNLSSVASSNGQYVTPTLSFDIDIGGSSDPGSTAPPYNTDFGVLSIGSVNSSPSRIWLSVATNSSNGVNIFVKGLNNGLTSSMASHTVASSTADLASVNNGYGAQVLTLSQTSGNALLKSTPYDGSADNVGVLDTVLRKIIYNSGPVGGGRVSVGVKARVDNLTPASNDYKDTLTFIASASF